MLTHQKCASIPLIYSTEAMHHNETHSLAIHVVDFCGLLSIAASHYCVHSGTMYSYTRDYYEEVLRPYCDDVGKRHSISNPYITSDLLRTI